MSEFIPTRICPNLWTIQTHNCEPEPNLNLHSSMSEYPNFKFEHKNVDQTLFYLGVANSGIRIADSFLLVLLLHAGHVPNLP